MLLGGDLGRYLDPASAALVVGPTIGTLFMSYPAKEVLNMSKHFKIILGMQRFNPLQYVDMMSGLAEKARSQGLLALESEADQMSDEFVKNAAMMVADAMDAEIVETRLNNVLDAMTARHMQAWVLYEKGAAYAPAFGMAATLVSLINMLMELNFEDASGVASLGINMSAAMITTFYGTLLANLWFNPLVAKLKVYHKAEVDCKRIVIEGILAIQRGTNPRVVKEMLIEQIDPAVVRKAQKASPAAEASE
ncbi:MAG: MotA/TolQ/ExbB proton channel family protein [Oscillospiraceae bacterium]|nr:MotA/TolQ/ExbB proton channel family protein [Oscillospiraceae bacterium]